MPLVLSARCQQFARDIKKQADSLPDNAHALQKQIRDYLTESDCLRQSDSKAALRLLDKAYNLQFCWWELMNRYVCAQNQDKLESQEPDPHFMSRTCLLDVIRTRAFVRSIMSAVADLECKVPAEQELNIIEVGCGSIPILSLCALSQSAKVKVFIVEIDAMSARYAQQCFEFCECIDRVEIIVGDALRDDTMRKLREKCAKPHIIISETMNASLKEEPMLDIFKKLHEVFNLKDVITIPQAITVLPGIIRRDIWGRFLQEQVVQPARAFSTSILLHPTMVKRVTKQNNQTNPGDNLGCIAVSRLPGFIRGGLARGMHFQLQDELRCYSPKILLRFVSSDIILRDYMLCVLTVVNCGGGNFLGPDDSIISATRMAMTEMRIDDHRDSFRSIQTIRAYTDLARTQLQRSRATSNQVCFTIPCLTSNNVDGNNIALINGKADRLNPPQSTIIQYQTGVVDWETLDPSEEEKPQRRKLKPTVKHCRV